MGGLSKVLSADDIRSTLSSLKIGLCETDGKVIEVVEEEASAI